VTVRAISDRPARPRVRRAAPELGRGRPRLRVNARAGYGAQGALTAQVTSAAHEVALSKALEPPLLAM